jgi:hypothetical protein
VKGCGPTAQPTSSIRPADFTEANSRRKTLDLRPFRRKKWPRRRRLERPEAQAGALAQNRVVVRIAGDEMAPSHIAILIPFILGLAATVATIAIHGVVFHIIVMSLRRDLKRGRLGARL